MIIYDLKYYFLSVILFNFICYYYLINPVYIFFVYLIFFLFIKNRKIKKYILLSLFIFLLTDQNLLKQKIQDHYFLEYNRRYLISSIELKLIDDCKLYYQNLYCNSQIIKIYTYNNINIINYAKVTIKIKNDKYLERIIKYFKGDILKVYPENIEDTLITVNKLTELKLNKFKHTIFNFIFTKISDTPNKISEFFLALFFAKREFVDRDLLKDFYKGNIGHILALSGMHLSFILAFINLIIFYFPKKINIISSYLFIIFYILLIGNQPSLIRAFIFLSFNYLSFLIKEHISFKRIISLSFCLQLLFFPQHIFMIGFYFSYLAIIALIYLYPIINNIFRISIISTSLSIFLLTFPLTIYLNSSIAYLSFIFSPIIILLIFIFMIISIIYFILLIFSIKLSILIYIMMLIIFLIEKINSFNIKFILDF